MPRKALNPSHEVAGRRTACLAAVFLSLLGILLFAAQARGAVSLGDALASASTTGTQAVASAAQPVRAATTAATADVNGATAPATQTIKQTSDSTLSTVANATSTAGAGQVVRQVGSPSDAVAKAVGTAAGAGLVTQAGSAVTETLHTDPTSAGTVTKPSAAGPVAPGGGPRANRPSGPSVHPSGAAQLAVHAGAAAWTGDPRPGLAPPSSSRTPAGLQGAQPRCAERGGCAGALTSAGGASDLVMLSANLQPAALGLDRDPASSASATWRGVAPPPSPRPEPSPTPGGIPLAGAAGSGFAVALLLALSLLLGAPPAMRRLRLAGERWGPAPLVLILERPD